MIGVLEFCKHRSCVQNLFAQLHLSGSKICGVDVLLNAVNCNNPYLIGLMVYMVNRLPEDFLNVYKLTIIIIIIFLLCGSCDVSLYYYNIKLNHLSHRPISGGDNSMPTDAWACGTKKPEYTKF